MSSRGIEDDALSYAIAIIESYQLDLRASNVLLAAHDVERLRAGETLAQIGFCQGSIYRDALGRIRRMAQEQAT